MTPDRWRRIEEVFGDTVDLPPEERAAYLDRVCSGETDLRREVESLLEADARLAESDDQEAPFATLILEAAVSLSKDERNRLVGQRVGSYRITEFIGRGGMAEVYLAVRDDDQYQKQVAIKLVRRGMVTDFLLNRFRYERQILASLDHPNIARLLDGGTTEDDIPYFVMEYVEGQPITTFCDTNGLSVRERLTLLRSVCAGVQHAHRNLVIHRDLKPSNILVTADGEPKLLDFGIAKLLSPEASRIGMTLAKTVTAMRLMTPDYASPEQARGEPVTTTTDVYSLGAVLYEMLTGKCPHQFKDRSLAEIEHVVGQAEIERPSSVVARRTDAPPRLARELKGDVDNIVLMALRKEPERRYQSVEQFSEDIRRYLEGRPVTARRDTVGYRAGKFIRRHKTAVGVAAALVVLLVAFSAIMGFQAARIARERDRANQVTEFLVDLFEVSRPSQARGEDVSAREVMDTAAERIERELAGQPEVQAALMDTIGRVYRSLGLHASAQPLIERALELRRATLGAEHGDVAASLHNLAMVHHYQGNYEEAERLYREALAMRVRLLGENHEMTAESYNDLGDLLRTTSKFDESEAMHRRALAVRRAVFGDESEDVAYSLHNLAAVLDDKGDVAGAEPLYVEALALKRRILGPEHPSVTNTLNNYALLLQNDGRIAEAEPLCREAVAIRRKVLGPEHPDLAVSLHNLATLLREKGDLDGAEQLLRENLALKRKIMDPTHPSIAIGLQNLGAVLQQKGDFAAAEPCFREALEIAEKRYTPDNWILAAVRRSYGACLLKLGRYREAERHLVAAYEGLNGSLGADNQRTRDTVGNLVELYEAMGRPGDADRYRKLAAGAAGS